MQDLQTYRIKIDEIDNKIIELLTERFKIIQKVWEYKKIHNLPSIQPDRWQEVLNTRKNKAINSWINPNLIENIWNEIHKEALNLENNIIINN